MDVRNKIIFRNTVLNFFGLVVPLAVGFVTIPMVVRALGNDRFGILALVWVVFGYFGLFDLGLGRTTTRYIADALGRNETEAPGLPSGRPSISRRRSGSRAAFLSHLAAPLIVRRILNIPDGFVGETILTLRLVGWSLPVMFVSSSFRGVLEAAQRFDLVNAVKVPVNVLFYVLPLAGVAMGFGLPGIVVLLVVSRAAALVVWGAMSLRVMPALRTRPVLHGKLVRPLFSFSGWLGLSRHPLRRDLLDGPARHRLPDHRRGRHLLQRALRGHQPGRGRSRQPVDGPFPRLQLSSTRAAGTTGWKRSSPGR